MDEFQVNTVNIIDITSEEMSNQLLRQFGNKFLSDSIRIISNHSHLPADNELVHEALCIIVALYTQKLKNGDIKIDEVLH